MTSAALELSNKYKISPAFGVQESLLLSLSSVSKTRGFDLRLEQTPSSSEDVLSSVPRNVLRIDAFSTVEFGDDGLSWFS